MPKAERNMFIFFKLFGHFTVPARVPGCNERGVAMLTVGLVYGKER
jgi:hypothetical protein